VAIDSQFWAGRRVLLTGHTGFKGAWLSLWLQTLQAQVTGLAAPGAPTEPSLYELARVGEGMQERAVDVRDARAVRDAIADARPEVVLHLAAQPLVRRSHREPALTYEVNVMGTVNVLEAVRQVGAEVRAVVVVTSDKCYENPPNRTPERDGAPTDGSRAQRRFVEGDPLGGADPYSSSKACAELVAAAYRDSFFAEDPAHLSPGDPPGLSSGDPVRLGSGDPAHRSSADTGRPVTRVATARAGNVIGGGDWGADRLIPDIVRAVQAGTAVRVRNPDAVRPWQHVLNPLCGYLTLAQELWRGRDAASAWNFGPSPQDARTVGWIVQRLAEQWGGALRWEVAETNGQATPEAAHLALDSSRAERGLGWRPTWDLEQALESVVQWHEAYRRGEDMQQTTVCQIGRFDQLVR
jgi:CDP-glucose 4,6-dehydratase